MMRRHTLALVLLVSLALIMTEPDSPTLAQSFSIPLNISNDPALSVSPDIAVDGAGTIHIVWQDPEGIFYTRSADGGLSFVSPILLPGSGGGVTPALAVDGSNVYVVYESAARTSAPHIVLSRSTNSGGTFSRPVIISSAPGASNPALAVGEPGTVYVAWVVEGMTPAIAFARSTNSGVSFSAPQTLSSAATGTQPANPDVAADRAGNVYVAWDTILFGGLASEVILRRSTNRGVSFESFPPFTLVSSTLGSSVNPALAVDRSGNLSVVWADNTPGLNGILFRRSTDQGRSFSPTLNAIPSQAVIAPGTVVPGFPDIVIDRAGTINVVGSIGRLQENELVRLDVGFARSEDMGSSFGAPLNLTKNQDGEFSGDAAVAAADQGSVYLVWTEVIEESFDIFFARGVSQEPQPDISVTPTSLDFGKVNVGQTADRVLMVSNVGQAPLNVNTITSTNPRFNVISPALPFTLAAGGQTNVTVRFSPTAVGLQMGTLNISSNDPDESVVAVVLSGEGVAALADLAVRSLAISPTTVPSGGVVNVSFSIINQGAGPAAGAFHDVRLSADSTITPEDSFLARVNTPSLNPGASFPFSLAVTILPGTPNGTIFIGVVADAINQVAESREDNNTAAGQITVVPAQADLIVQRLSVSPANVAPGDQVRVEFTVLNQGSAAASGITHQIRLSDDEIITPADPLLASVPDQASLGLNQSRSFVQLVTIPTRATAGPKFIGVIADGLHGAVESDESNNTATTPITIQFAVVSVFPANGALNAPLVSNVQVEFSAPLVVESVNAGTLVITTATGAPVSGTVAAVNNRAFFFPSDRLLPQTSYQIRVVGGSAGVRGLVGGIPMRLSADFLSTFTTESEAARSQPPTDGQQPVRVEFGGTITDDAGTGAAVTVPPFTLKTDAVVNIVVLDSAARLSEINPQCDVPIEAMSLVQPVEGFLRVSEVVRYESQPCGAVGFGPGLDFVFPLRSAFRGGFLLGTRLRVFQLITTEEGLAFVDTGIDAEVTLPGTLFFGDFAVASGIEVFGTYALFISTGDLPSSLANVIGSLRLEVNPWSKLDLIRAQLLTPIESKGSERKDQASEFTVRRLPPTVLPLQSSGASQTLYFPVVDNGTGRDTELSLANPDRSQSRVVTLTAYNNDGRLRGSPQTVTVSPGSQITLRVSGLFPGLQGAIVAEADGVVTAFYEIADDFTNPQMLDGADAVAAPQDAFVFPIIRTTGGTSTELHLFNPNEFPVEVRLTAYNSSGSRLSLATETFTLGPKEQLVRSSTGASSGAPSVTIPFDQLEGGSIFVESVNGEGLIGAELMEETLLVSGTTERNLAVLNAVRLPSGCQPTGMGSCQIAGSVPEASRQHTTYTVHLERDPYDAEVFLVNPSDSDALVAFSAFDSAGRFLRSHPTQGFLTLRAHEVLRRSVRSLFGFNPGQLGGYLRIEDQHSVVVGAVVNRDAAMQKFLTVLPLAPDLAQDGQTVTAVSFSRLQILAASPSVQTGLVILNPNNNTVRFAISVLDSTGSPVGESTQMVVGRGMYIRTRDSLTALFPGASNGSFQIQVNEDLIPGTGERVIPYAIYRSANYLSAVPPQ